MPEQPTPFNIFVTHLNRLPIWTVNLRMGTSMWKIQKQK